MWQFIRSRILTVIIFIGAAHGLLVVGPKFIRPNQNYTIGISNFKADQSNVNMVVRIKGYTDDGRNILNVTNTVDVPRYMNRMVNFNMPNDLSAGNYKISFVGQNGYVFYMDADLVYLGKSISGLIQTNKLVFKPGDVVKFRVIVLDSELKPPAVVKTVHVAISDHEGNMIQKWSSAKLYAGVFESDLQLSHKAMLGMWNISVQVDGEELVSKTFEVKEYALSTFDVEVISSVIPLEEHQGLNLTIAANYHLRKPVLGMAKVELYLDDNKLDQQKVFKIYGMRKLELQFVELFKIHEDQKDVVLRTTFIEHHTNRTVVKESQITVFKYPYRVQLIKESSSFQPRLPFKCALKFQYHDGTPAKGITGKVEVMEIGYETTATSNDEGLIKLELNPDDSVESMYINFSNDDDGFYFYENVDKENVVRNAYIKLELRSPIKLDRLLQFMITCSEPMAFFIYYVVSKGNIVDCGFIRLNNQQKYPFRLNASLKMTPKAKIFVATEVNRVIVYDYVDIEFKDLRNDINLRIDRKQAEPGQKIELCISGQPGAYVALAAYNNGSMYKNENHDLFWKDIMRVYNGIGSNVENVDVDEFHRMGLFVKPLYNIHYNEFHDMAARYELRRNNPIPKLESSLTNFPESWLWQNVTIGRSGMFKMIEAVPDIITSWYLTGFSIDPEYGLGIIKKPIHFTTFQPFYIVENLPSSIKRYKTVELQFALFNLLEEEYIADVTLDIVDEQAEFIGRPPAELSYTESVRVPPKVDVPISFLVKPRKLGEMVVRVKATMKSTQLTDVLEKVIRVMPESVAHSKKDSWFFCFDKPTNQTFLKTLQIPNADSGSVKMEFVLNPNLLIVIDNLYQLLDPSSGNGEENMKKFAPDIMVLDYLHAIGSEDEFLIEKATNLVRQGYRNQMRYRKEDGSFAVRENRGGSVFLTAFVAKSMPTASKYISEVNTDLLEKAYDWLAAKQLSTGRFDEVGPVINKGMQGGLSDGVTLTSFVVTALLENENVTVKHAAVIDNAMNYLSSQVETIDNPYELSIVTYALMLNGHPLKHTAFNKLVNMSTFAQAGSEQYWNTEHGIETAAYALLSFVISEKYLDGIPVMRWLTKQPRMAEEFWTPLPHFLALKALTKMAEKISPSRNKYDVYLQFKNLTKHFHINWQDSDTIYSVDIPEDIKSMEINVDGIGFGLLQVVYKYSLNVVHFENRFKLDVEKQNTISDYELQLKVCVSFIPTLFSRESGMTTVEVTFPSGYNVDPNPISKQTTMNEIRQIEIKYGATTVVVYYGFLDEERNCFTVTAYRRGKVAMKRPGYVVVYDYYDKTSNAIKMYEMD